MPTGVRPADILAPAGAFVATSHHKRLLQFAAEQALKCCHQGEAGQHHMGRDMASIQGLKISAIEVHSSSQPRMHACSNQW